MVALDMAKYASGMWGNMLALEDEDHWTPPVTYSTNKNLERKFSLFGDPKTSADIDHASNSEED